MINYLIWNKKMYQKFNLQKCNKCDFSKCFNLFQCCECCKFCDDRKNIVFKDKKNKQEYRIENKNKIKISKIEVDNCLILEGNKCDFLAIKYLEEAKKTSIDSLYFIELKGSDLRHAIIQIQKTIDKVKKHIEQYQKNLNYKIYARIVLNKESTPKLNSSEKMKLNNLLKKYKGNLKTQTIKMTELF